MIFARCKASSLQTRFMLITSFGVLALTLCMVGMVAWLETARDFAAPHPRLGLVGGVALIGATGLLLAIRWVFSRVISRRLRQMTATMLRLARGETDLDIQGQESGDEIGAMARAVSVFRDNAVEARRLADEQAAGSAAEEARQAAIKQDTQNFGASVSGVMSALGGSAEGMRQAASTMSEATATVHERAVATASAAVRSSSDLGSVAMAIDGLRSAVGEISRQVATASQVAREAVSRAEASHTTMHGLAEATGRIGDVVKLIDDIASQTNLLALNATIEAARAGEAGRGFAVVAGEVKALARQTGHATADIAGQIATVRGATEQAIAAMTEVGAIIGKMDAVAAAIASAVEEQSATTHEIAGSVQAVAEATNHAAQAMAEVSTIAENASGVSQQVLEAAAELGRQADTLRTEVEQFLAAVREETSDRRRYGRVFGREAAAVVRTAGYPKTRARLRDLAPGGGALVCGLALPARTELEVEFPDQGVRLPARVVRAKGGVLAVAFPPDPATLAKTKRLIDMLGSSAAAQVTGE